MRSRVFPPQPARWRRAALVGGAVATVLFAWVVLIGRAELTGAPTGDFFDLQVRAWFDGRWDIEDRVDPDTGQRVNPLSIEAIVVDDRSYLYYGPVPSVLRTPLLAATSGLDGRTTQPFMLAAFVLSLSGANALGWRLRCLVRRRDGRSIDPPAAGEGTADDARSVDGRGVMDDGHPIDDRGVTDSRRAIGDAPPLDGGEALVAGVTMVAVGAGTVALYLGSQPTVYHEATLWGLGFGLWAYAALLDATVHTTVRTVSWAGALTGLALLSRASVGIGPLVGLGLLLVVTVVGVLRSRSGRSPSANLDGDPVASAPVPVLMALVVACVAPVALYGAVNLVKFGEPFRLPLEKQVYSQIDPDRIAALEANDGSLFSLGYLPSTVWQYARPDAVAFDRLAPWLVFPRQPATVVGDATFDTRDVSSSVPVTMPLWVVLAGVGAVALTRDLIGRRGGVAPLWVAVVGAGAGTAGVLTIGFIAHRYLGDLLPLLVLLGLAGAQALVAWARTRARSTTWGAAGVLGVLALWGVAANVALALEYQRLIAPVDPATRVAFVSWQHTLADAGDRVAPGPPPGRHEVDERGWRYVVTGPDGGCWWSDGTSAQRLGDTADEVCRMIGPPIASGVGSSDRPPPAETP